MSKTKTMLDLFNYLKSNNYNLIQNPSDVLISLGYENNRAKQIDVRYLTSTYRNLELLDTIYYADGVIDYEWLQTIIDIVQFTYEYKYKKLKQTIDYDYDYSKNYNRTKKSTVTDVFGEQNTKNIFGTEKTTNNIGAFNGESENLKMAFDTTATGDYSKDSKSVSSTSEQTNTITTDEKTDNVSRETYTDTHTVEETEYGDLSVRLVADTIKAEREIAYFSVWDEIFKDIMKEISTQLFYFGDL